ncbi:MAG: IS4 family transposase [Rhizobiaceae bacterium]|nr:IS4 family transposase [Rhizobiaceae bacterium]
MSAKLTDTLIFTLSSHLDLGKTRLQTLACLIVGLVNARTINLTHIASQFSGTAQVSSSYRRLQRFFQYVCLDGDWLALVVIRLLNIRPPWVLCLDRTNWKVGRRDVHLLMLAVVTRRARIPLMWRGLDKDGISNTSERIDLLRRYLDLFGSRSIAWFLADREFIGEKWMGFLLENNILFAIRVKKNTRIVLEDGRTYSLKTLLQKRRNAKWLKAKSARFALMAKTMGTPLRFAAKRLADGQLLIIATNGMPNKALNAYKRRWQIECLFGDSKTRGLNMEDTRLTQPQKLNTMLVIITLAMAWAYASATALKGHKAIKKGNHGYRLKSWFRTGFDQLRKWILHHPKTAADIWCRMWPRYKSRLKFIRVV